MQYDKRNRLPPHPSEHCLLCGRCPGRKNPQQILVFCTSGEPPQPRCPCVLSTRDLLGLHLGHLTPTSCTL